MLALTTVLAAATHLPASSLLRPAVVVPTRAAVPHMQTNSWRLDQEDHLWRKKKRTPVDTAASQRCLARGRGYWQLAEQQAYILAPQTIGSAEYGMCDRARQGFLVAHPNVSAGKRARTSALHSWVPSSKDDTDCHALLKGNTTMPSIAVLTRAFCHRWAGRSILIVGDSIQFQLFVSFSALFGAVPRARCDAACSKCNQKGEDITPSGRPKALEAALCGHRTADAVTLRYIVTPYLGPDPGQDPGNIHTRNTTEPKAVASAREGQGAARAKQLELARKKSCYHWEAEMGESHLVVLSLGTWRGFTEAEHAERLGFVLTRLAKQRAAKSLPPISEGVVVRGTHAATPDCFELHDPLPPNDFDLTRYIRRVSEQNSLNGTAYNWDQFEGFNNVTRRVAAAHGVTYLDVYLATALRPGGRRPAFHDCLHYCLPGPPDDWVRMLLMLWT